MVKKTLSHGKYLLLLFTVVGGVVRSVDPRQKERV